MLSLIGVGTILGLRPDPAPAKANPFVFELQLRAPMVALATVVGAMLMGAGCGKAPDTKAAQDQSAARQFNADKAAAARELAELASRRQEMEAANQKETSRESDEVFKKFASERPIMTGVEEAKAQDDSIERLRKRVAVPSTMQVRNVRFNVEKTAICMEVTYAEDGRIGPFRRAFATPDTAWIEPNQDDVAHRVFVVKFERMGCGTAVAGSR